MHKNYPTGHLKNFEELKALIEIRDIKPTTIYLISNGAYKVKLDSNTEIHPSPQSAVENIHLSGGPNTLTFRERDGRLQSCATGGYVFANYWHAYAYLLQLKASGELIGENLPL